VYCFLFADRQLVVKTPHTCQLKDKEFQLMEAKHRMKVQAMNTPENLHDIYHEVLNGFPKDIADSVGYHSVLPSLKNARSRRYEKANCSPGELTEYLDSSDCLEEVKVLYQGSVHYTELDGEGNRTDQYAVILGSPNILQVVGEDNIYMMADATFSTSPRPFAQLFNIMVSYKGTPIPILHVCMTHKSAPLYEGVLMEIRRICPLLEPRVIKTDYEGALLKAVEASFPGVTQSGCRFHYAQAVFRAINKPGKAKNRNSHT
jgi:hypothetical protein